MQGGCCMQRAVKAVKAVKAVFLCSSVLWIFDGYN